MKSYTNLEQSKKLAEILPIDSVDMYYCYGMDIHTKEWSFDSTPTIIDNSNQIDVHADIPCWSLAALINILPSEFTEKGKYSETTYDIRIRKHTLIEDLDLYQIAYGNYIFYEDGSPSWKDMINTGEKENLIDAAFQMIIWLKENNKL